MYKGILGYISYFTLPCFSLIRWSSSWWGEEYHQMPQKLPVKVAGTMNVQHLSTSHASCECWRIHNHPRCLHLGLCFHRLFAFTGFALPLSWSSSTLLQLFAFSSTTLSWSSSSTYHSSTLSALRFFKLYAFSDDHVYSSGRWYNVKREGGTFSTP